MRQSLYRLLFLLLLSFPALSAAATTYTLHVQSPWTTTDSLYVTGGFTGAYNVGDAGGYMTPEGDGWYVYTKTLEDGATVQTWWSFSIKSSAGTWGVGELNVAKIFGAETEIWIYTSTTDDTYEISAIAPNSKIVWFKSPWGNKALPNLIHGADTIRMRFVVDDASHCGWFFGALSKEAYAASSAVYFQQAYTTNTLPASGSLDLASAFSAGDSAFVDGTASLAVSNSIGTLGTCFDSSRTLHVYHPWRSDAAYKDSVVYMSVGNNILNQPTAMDSTGEYDYWFKYSFTAATASKTDWFSASAKVEFYKKQNCWPACDWFSVDSLRPTISEIFPSGIYEAWIFPKGEHDADVSYVPIAPHYITLLSPWDNTTPIMIIAGDTIAMRPVANYCGWYQGIYYKYNNDWDAIFRQRFGFEYYTAKGVDSTFENPISLDSAFALNDSIWVQPVPMPAGNPVVLTKYPTGVLGDCPTRSISAMMFDWYDGSENNGVHYYPALDTGVNIDFGGAYDGTSKTQKTINGVTHNGCQGLHVGMVEDTLSAAGVPIRNLTSFPEDSCTTADHLNGWFLADTLVTSGGTAYTNTSCYDIPLSLDEEGFWLADYMEVDNDTTKIGFFPLDDFRFLDSNNTVANPIYDSINGGYRGWHNYGFSMKVQAQFVYVKGQYFEFRGDDDVWVYINGKLVVDIGGVHSPVEGKVDLDTLNLVEGNTYPFRIFFSERNPTGSNFKMRTSIDLQTERSYYYDASTTAAGLPEYKLKQLIREQSLSCDFTNGSATEKSAPSTFVLSGGTLSSSVTLSAGANYGGIVIADDYASFTIDTAAIVASRSLAPGTYTVTFTLTSDASLSNKIQFTINSYPLPTIAFSDTSWNEIASDTVTLGEWAFVPYRVNVIVYYMGNPCDSGCDEMLKLSTADSLAFQDASGNKIDSIKLSGGHASFWVYGTSVVTSASFKVFGSTVDNELTWKNINLKEPPVPSPTFAGMYDRTGDGVADSLVLKYSKKLEGDDVPDSLAWLFGDSTWHKLDSSAILNGVVDSSVVITSDSLLKFLFTGSLLNAKYSGTSKTSFSYIPTDGTDSGSVQSFQIAGSISDKIGPVVKSAQVVAKSATIRQLTVSFSETMGADSGMGDYFLEFRMLRNGAQNGKLVPVRSGTWGKNRVSYSVYFSGENDSLPSVGDSVRLVPASIADLSGNSAQENNRWVRITGEQYVGVASSKVVDLNPGTAPNKDSVVLISTVPLTEKFEDVEKNAGVPGFLVRYDLSALVSDTVKAKSVKIDYEIHYYTNLGQFVNSAKGSVSCTDAAFNGDCTSHPGNVYFGWNMHSSKGRLVGSGAYIAKMDFKIKAGYKTLAKKQESAVWGIRRTSK